MRRVSDSQTVVAVTPTRRMRRPRFDEERHEPSEPPSTARGPRSEPPERGAEDEPPPAGTHVDEFA